MKLFAASIFLTALFFANLAEANHAPGHISPPSGGCNSAGGFTNPLQFCSLQEFLTAVLGVVVDIGFPIVVVAIIWTGFLFVKAQGNPDALTIAKKAFFWTLVGALLVLGAFALSTLVQGTVDQIT